MSKTNTLTSQNNNTMTSSSIQTIPTHQINNGSQSKITTVYRKSINQSTIPTSLRIPSPMSPLINSSNLCINPSKPYNLA